MFRLSAVATFLIFLFLLPASAQNMGQPPIRGSNDRRAEEEIDRDTRLKLQKERQKKRAQDMKRDSQKLLELATELKQYVDKSGENILSMDVVRKAEEMEKLARQVKNNMRGE